MQRRFRLTGSADVQRVWRLGKSHAHPLIVLIAWANPVSNTTRFAVVAGRAVGKAVERNRAKRRLRAAIQPHLSAILPGWDVILIARKPILGSDFQHIQVALEQLLNRARLFQVYPQGNVVSNDQS